MQRPLPAYVYIYFLAHIHPLEASKSQLLFNAGRLPVASMDTTNGFWEAGKHTAVAQPQRLLKVLHNDFLSSLALLAVLISKSFHPAAT